jgi:hypothetical protein
MGRRLLTLALLLTGPGSGPADVIRLSDGGLLDGKAVSMDRNGVVTVETEISPGPVSIRPEGIRQVLFSHDGISPDTHDARVQLTNGDLIPCDLKTITAEEVEVSTDFAGNLSIPRKFVRLMQLGVRPRRVLLDEIGQADDWNISRSDWIVENGVLVSSGSGHAGRAIDDLPDAFSVSFLLQWEQRPVFKFFFCADPKQGSSGNQDRYYLQFNAAGFGLKRQSTGSTAYPDLGVVTQTPDQFKERQVHIELRVDRRTHMIHLFLDGRFEGRFPDQLDTVPDASGIVFESGNSASRSLRISALTVREWDASGDRHESEDRGDPSLDAVIDHVGQRMSGRLLKTAPGEQDRYRGETVVLFQSPHLEKPIEIPVDGISTIFLNGPEFSPEPPELSFGLVSKGRVTATGARFDPNGIHLDHPLLGPLTLARPAVLSLDRRAPEPDEPSDDS